MKLGTLSVVASLAVVSGQASGAFLGTAQSFAVLASSTATNTGPSVLTGDLGVWPGNAISGFPPGIVNGTMHAADFVAQQAHADATTAYTTLAGLAMTTDLTGTDLGGRTLTPGVYFFSSSAFLTGTLTLDAQGNPDALFVFQIGSSATIGTGTSFQSNILALASITLTANATLDEGRAIALTGAVTMDSNRVTAGCLPTPGTGMAMVLACFVAAGRRRS